MKVYLDKNKNYYKANLHCHSRYSDGRATREEIKEQYKAHGYSAVAFTDHEHTIGTEGLSDDEFIAIVGCELAVVGPECDLQSPSPSTKQVHMCFYAKDPSNTLTPCYNEERDVRFYKYEDVRHLVTHEDNYNRVHTHEGINEMIRIGHEKGFLVSFNHPAWSLQNGNDYLGYEGFDFVEVHNSACEVVLGLPSAEIVYNEMLHAGKRIYCSAADDNHNGAGFEGPRSDSFSSWVMINAEKLDYASLMNGLENGDFYASTGPEIYSLTVEDDLCVHVTFSPDVYRASIITQGRGSSAKYDFENNTAVFKIAPKDVSFRIRLEDKCGKKAYTQLYDIPEDITAEVRRIAEEKAAAEKAAKQAAKKA